MSEYNSKYFQSEIFKYEYESIAAAIVESYHPKTIIEFGCGNGDLTKAFAARGINVCAVDGFSDPDFASLLNIRFKKVDLNNEDDIKMYLSEIDQKFDIAICLEVAEHLKPSVSKFLIKAMTSVADVVVFSAAVPEQSGAGHINCKGREEWHELFTRNGFFIADTIRGKLRNKPNVANWYKLNIVDYYRSDTEPSKEMNDLIKRLVASESYAASHFYKAQRKFEYYSWALHLKPIREIIKLRNFFTKIAGKTSINLNKS